MIFIGFFQEIARPASPSRSSTLRVSELQLLVPTVITAIIVLTSPTLGVKSRERVIRKLNTLVLSTLDQKLESYLLTRSKFIAAQVTARG